MAIISEGDVFTQIVRFNVGAGKQRALIDAVASEVERWIRHRPGFISASLHASDDGKHVMNYAQWKDKASYEAFLDDAEGEKLLEAIDAVDPNSKAHGFHCRVVRSISAR